MMLVSYPTITLWQPWATLVAAGAKPFEFRAWPAPQRLWGRRVAGHTGTLPGKVHVLPRPDGHSPRPPEAADRWPAATRPAPTAGEVARTLAGAGACALIAGAVAAIYSPWLAVLVVAPFVAVAGLEAGRWWRGRRA